MALGRQRDQTLGRYVDATGNGSTSPYTFSREGRTDSLYILMKIFDAQSANAFIRRKKRGDSHLAVEISL